MYPPARTQPKSPAPGGNLRGVGRYWWWGLLAVVLLTMVSIRVRLLDFPLERDEGEYAYAGQLILERVPPYQDCYNMKWPGTYLAYAAIMAVFGETPAGIHLGVLLVSTASALLVFLIGRRMGGDGMGAIAGSTQALLSTNPWTLGLQGHATHFVVLPALAGIWLLMQPWESIGFRRCLGAGALFGLACMMKQQGAVFGVFAFVWLLWRGFFETSAGWKGVREALPRVGCLVGGGLLPLLAMAGWLAAAGVWGNFWHWTIDYARAYVGITAYGVGLELFRGTVNLLWGAAPGLWLAAAVGLAVLWWEPALAQWRFFLVAFALFSFAGVCPGLYFTPHYFLLLVPAAALLCGAGWRAAASCAAGLLCGLERASGHGDAAMRGWVRKPVFANGVSITFAGLFILASAQSLIASSDVFFQLTPREACRKIYGDNPFPDAIQVANYIAQHSPPDARIAVLGSEPEIYFYSHRRSATGYIYTYPLMEAQPFAAQMQQDMMHEIERAAPEYVVIVLVPASWLKRAGSDTTIFGLADRYCREQMKLDAILNVPGDDPSAGHWNLGGVQTVPLTASCIVIYKRK